MMRYFLPGAVFFLAMVSAAAASERPYSRIISLYSAHTENLVSMGAGEKLIGISTSDDYPPEILDKPRFSYRQDAEKFITARPDLVLVRPMIERSYPQLLAKLRQAGVKVVSLQPTSITAIYGYWQELGRLSGQEAESVSMCESFAEQLQKIARKTDAVPKNQRPRVYFESIHKKMKTFAPQSIAIFALEHAGGINIAADAFQLRKTNIAAYGKEHILAKGDDIDVFVAQQGRMNPVTKEMIEQESGFRAIKAVAEGRVFLIEEQLVSRPTLRILEGIEKLYAFFYPQADRK